jgi:hypothetical protein
MSTAARAGQVSAASAAVGGRFRAAAASPLVPALLVVVAATALRLSGTVDSDVAWQLWIAHQLNGGATLYRDIIEINPPLWFWMALPIDWLATHLGTRIETMLILAIGAASMVSLTATHRLLFGLDRGRKALLLAYAALALTVVPWMHVGQREQIVLIATLPYAALIACRREARAVPARFAALIGAGAALGFALKHYFLLAPALLELWLVIADRRSWRILRPEIIAMAAVGAIYACAALLWDPDYFTSVLPMVRLAYGDTGAPSISGLFQPALLVAFAMLALVALNRDQLSGTAFAQSLTIAAVGFAGVYFLQAKGWTYHAIPLLGCASLALAALLAQKRAVSPELYAAAAALLSLPLVLAWEDSRYEPLPSPDLEQALSGTHPGQSVGFVATDPALAWSVTLQRGYLYPSRYMGFWMLRAVVEKHADPRLRSLGSRVIRETVIDLRCAPPVRIIVARPRPGPESAGSFDILPFFLRDAEFARFLAHYRPVSRTSVEEFDLAHPFPALSSTECRKVL